MREKNEEKKLFSTHQVRQDKRAAKEKRREEARMKEVVYNVGEEGLTYFTSGE